MKVLLVGCGSIGKRHLQNLNRLDEVESIYVYSKVRGCLDALKNKRKVFLVSSLNNVQADLAIIANETHKHLDTAILLAKKGINLFIEKPLSHGLSKKLEILKNIAKKNRVKLCVGYNLRFLGAIKLIKDKLSRGVLGNIYFVKIEAGQYLPSWRVGRDYRFSYSASKRCGGGVALDLSHEIDYMRYFFGDPRSWYVAKSKVSDLKIDSEDLFEGVYLYNNFICNVHLDYLNKNKTRTIRIEASKGILNCDLISKRMDIEIGSKKQVFSAKKLFDLEKTYVNEILSFINSIKNNKKAEIGIEDGIKALELIEERNV